MDLRTFKSAQFRQRIGESQKDEIGTGARVKSNVVIFGLDGVKPASAQLVWKPRQYSCRLRSLRRFWACVEGVRLDGTPLN
jgi:hypothetical protein